MLYQRVVGTDGAKEGGLLRKYLAIANGSVCERIAQLHLRHTTFNWQELFVHVTHLNVLLLWEQRCGCMSFVETAFVQFDTFYSIVQFIVMAMGFLYSAILVPYALGNWFGFFFIYLSKLVMTFNKVECLISALHEIADDRTQPNLIEHRLFCSCISVIEANWLFSHF